MCPSPYFTSEPTELTGLFVEKPPENVVAVSGMPQRGQRKIRLKKLLSQRSKSWLFVWGWQEPMSAS